MYVIELEKIKKKYGRIFILNEISVSMEKGKIYGLLGVNGAGKTTLMRVIAGLASKDSGTVRLFESEDLNGGRRKMGTAIENPVFFRELSAFENLQMYNSVCGMRKEELEDLLTAVGLENSKKKARNFSLGMKQKLALAITLLGNPQLLLLDEPANGLDPVSVKALRNQIVRLNRERGMSFLISSHDVNELIRISDILLIMQSGRITYEMDRRELAERAAKAKLDMQDYIVNLMEKTDG